MGKCFISLPEKKKKNYYKLPCAFQYQEWKKQKEKTGKHVKFYKKYSKEQKHSPYEYRDHLRSDGKHTERGGKDRRV